MKSKLFGRVRVRLDELDSASREIDFADRLRKNTPVGAAAEQAQPPRPEDAQAQRAAEPLPAVRSDGIDGDEMSDGDDDQRGQQPKKGRGIFESIIAKWTSMAVPGQKGGDSDEDDDGGQSGDSGDVVDDSGQPRAHACVLVLRGASHWHGASLPRGADMARGAHTARAVAPNLLARVPMQTTTTTTTV